MPYTPSSSVRALDARVEGPRLVAGVSVGPGERLPGYSRPTCDLFTTEPFCNVTVMDEEGLVPTHR